MTTVVAQQLLRAAVCGLALQVAAEAHYSDTDAMQTWTVSALQRVFLDSQRPSAVQASGSAVALAAGELESTQLVVRMAKNASVGISFVTSADWPTQHLHLQWQQVGHVEVKDIRQPALIEPERGPGWWPDPLLPVPRMIATPGEACVAWVTVTADAGCSPGNFSASVELQSSDGEHRSVTLAVEVFGFALPTTFKLRTAIDFDRQKLSAVYGNSFHIAGRTSRSSAWIENITRVYEDWILRELRFTPGNIYSPSNERIPVARLSALAALGLNAFNVPLPFGKGSALLQAALQNISAPGGYLDQLDQAGLLQFASTYGFDESEDFDAIESSFAQVRLTSHFPCHVFIQN